MDANAVKLGLSPEIYRDCQDLLKEVYDRGLLEEASTVIRNWRQFQRGCVNETDVYTMEDINLVPDVQIVMYDDPSDNKTYCFEKSGIDYLLQPQQSRDGDRVPVNPYTRAPLSDEFVARLRLITSRPEATQWTDVMRETFAEEVVPEREETEEERERAELRRKKAEIQGILERLDVYISLDTFLDSPLKFLPENINPNDKTAIINYLYEKRNQTFGYGNVPLIYMIVKYDDNLRKLANPDLPEDRGLIIDQNAEILGILGPLFRRPASIEIIRWRDYISNNDIRAIDAFLTVLHDTPERIPSLRIRLLGQGALSIPSVEMLRLLVRGLGLTKENLLGLPWLVTPRGVLKFLFEEMDFTKQELKDIVHTVRDPVILKELLEIGFTIDDLVGMIPNLNRSMLRVFGEKGYTINDLIPILPIAAKEQIIGLLSDYNIPLDTIKFLVSRGYNWFDIQWMVPRFISDIGMWKFLIRNTDIMKPEIIRRLPHHISSDLERLLIDYAFFTQREIRSLQIAGWLYSSE